MTALAARHTAGRRLATVAPRTTSRAAQRRGPGSASAQQSSRLVAGLAVAVLVAVAIILAGRPLLSAHEWNSRQSAMDATDRYLFRARAVALRAARNSWLVRKGNVVEVFLDSAGKAVSVAPPMDLGARYRVALSMPSDTVAFDPRGYVLSGPRMFVIANAHGADTACVNPADVRGCR